ncbi:hypothetical protein [Nonomuraea sp. CA-141351]|uniref:hypothetical protein n=1 Tax=Nonomuraea sp. CA-141351 TaxID=3239996 RepID=UPI003D8F7E6E
MPKLKTVMAGLAIGTAMSGGVLALSATTTSASAGTAEVTTGTSVLTGGGCGWRRCGGWGWGGRGWGRRNNRTDVFVNNNNINFNRDHNTHRERRFDHHVNKFFHDDDDDDDD